MIEVIATFSKVENMEKVMSLVFDNWYQYSREKAWKFPDSNTDDGLPKYSLSKPILIRLDPFENDSKDYAIHNQMQIIRKW